jgi:hypothetical protein
VPDDAHPDGGIHLRVDGGSCDGLVALEIADAGAQWTDVGQGGAIRSVDDRIPVARLLPIGAGAIVSAGAEDPVAADSRTRDSNRFSAYDGATCAMRRSRRFICAPGAGRIRLAESQRVDPLHLASAAGGLRVRQEGVSLARSL